MSLCSQIKDLLEYLCLSSVLKCYSAPRSRTSSSTPEDTVTNRLRLGPGKVSLQKIVWKAKPYEALDATIERNFILKHEKFVQPEYVLQVGLGRFLNIPK